MKVSALVITYNHEPFIARTLDSILMQEVNFPFEIVIGEDCSSDNTREILLQYQRRFPEKIRLLLRQSNVGMMANFIGTANSCKGEYIAIIEGDDYWTSPFKLQKQVDFLDSHRDFSSCFHNVTVLAGGKETMHYTRRMKEAFYLEDVVQGNFIHTCSVMYRNGLTFPDWLLAMPMGDWPLHILNAQRGPIGYIDDVMACYRVHETGVWSSKKKHDVLAATKQTALAIDSHLNHAYTSLISKTISLWDVEMATLMAKEGNIPACIEHLKAAIARAPSYPKAYRRIITKVLPQLLKEHFH